MKKKIAIHQLKPGMYVAGTDRSWLQLPFFRRLIRGDDTVEKLRAAGVAEVVIDTHKGEDVPSGDPASPVDPFDHPEVLTSALDAAKSVQGEAVAATARMMNDAQKGIPLDHQAADTQVGRLLNQLMDDPQSMLCISVLKNADEYTFEHCVNGAILALFVGRNMGLSRTDMLDLGKAALLHDIGKCMVPNDIVTKPGRLTDEEEAVMRTHVDKGLRYLKKSQGLSTTVLDVVAQHHERLNGTGYPRGLKGDALSPLSRLCAIIDTYDTMIHENYYKSTYDPTFVLNDLSPLVGTAFCPDAFKALADCLGTYPPGTLLMLNTGEMAISYQPDAHNPHRPKILLLTAVDGSFYTQPTPASLTDVDPATGTFARTILTTLSLEDSNFNPFDILQNYALHQKSLE